MPLKCSPLVLIGALAAGALASPIAASASQSSGINLTLSSATTHVTATPNVIRIAAVGLVQPLSHDHDSDWNGGGVHHHDHTAFLDAQRTREGAFTA